MARPSLGSAPLTVACVLRRGGLYWGSREGPYFSKYVRILRDAVAQQLSLPHRFVCLTDVAVPCAHIELHEFWPGAWAKLELFKRGLFDGPVLYFDLSAVVLGGLDELARAALDGDFGAVRHRQGGLDATVMAWRVDCSFIQRRYGWLPEFWRYRHRAQGHRGFIEAELGRAGIAWHPIDAALPGAVIDYAGLGPDGAIPSSARLCVFHGRPRPHELEIEQFAHWDRAGPN
ncbi:MAG: hypothetical protein JO055_08230 [Alphaproteobacteria bacterium]|nr:hypothetical protein [Alphaproteobacteria bacterium]